jgi:hypothetical protein
MLGTADRWRILVWLARGLARVGGACLLLASCHRVVLIEAVDGPEESPSRDDPGSDPDVEDSEDPDVAEAATESPPKLPNPSTDAGPELNTPIDAGDGRASVDARVADGGRIRDAGADAARPARDAGALPACAGTRVHDLCWYLGAQGASCDQACSGKGGYDARGTALVGTAPQGGSLGACAQVLAALGYTGPVFLGLRSDGIGLGCHLWESDGWWLEAMADLSSTASIPVVSRACACMR